ncbi:OsmC family protein [Paenibacillus donghaensis]|uniref:Osmotically inducible protein OsmC n=1 Tax=Paenibacillus donghaensis TaxID=414771 RepID=A0A2Z2KG66_9BACL|nr:OsmC family protein [Paenibacillus donghaensis]ASA25164.1 osmotically inducible protein OsmC [Paenibacillus donghaensis]
MTTVKFAEGQNEIYNEAGLQIIGSTAPNQSGLSPRELLEAALGLCVSISLQKILDYDKKEYDKSSIGVEVTAVKAADGTNRFTNFAVRVKLPSTLDSTYKEKLMSVVERACTIGNTLKGEVIIETIEI